jgi:tRNA pseudouridine38-40 synthase
MTRYKLIIEYFGRDYAGWQRQDRVPTIQQEIEEAIFKFSGQKVLIQGAGRTDAGVHARGQVAHVDLEPFSKPMSGFEIAKAINAHLRPRAISIIHVEPAPEDFHARFSANNKLYHYRIVNRSALLALDQGLSWHIKRRLDVAAMHEAAQYLVGTHDFTSFRDTACQAKSPEKSLLRLDVTARPCDEHGGQEILIAAEGRSFLHHQVRNMVGTLSLVGEGKWNPQDVQSVLQAKDRTKSGPTAPAEGLYLMRIDY